MYKFIFALFIFSSSTGAFTADREIGTVIAVERTYSFDLASCQAYWNAETLVSGRCKVPVFPQDP